MSHTYPRGTYLEDTSHVGEPNEPEKRPEYPEKHGSCKRHVGVDRRVRNGYLHAICEECGATLRAVETIEEDGGITVLEWEVIS